MTILGAAALDFGIQALMGGLAILMKTEYFYDLTGSCTFILLAVQMFL